MERRMVGELGIIAMRGCEEMAEKVDKYLICKLEKGFSRDLIS